MAITKPVEHDQIDTQVGPKTYREFVKSGLCANRAKVPPWPGVSTSRPETSTALPGRTLPVVEPVLAQTGLEAGRSGLSEAALPSLYDGPMVTVRRTSACRLSPLGHVGPSTATCRCAGQTAMYSSSVIALDTTWICDPGVAVPDIKTPKD
jgi:hypothetical protein